MKHMENRQELDWERLEQELELAQVPAAVDRRLRQVYAELPQELPGKPARGSRKAVRTFATAASALAAAFLLVFGVNAVNPALAEELPLIGGIFQRINGSAPYRASYQNEEAAQAHIVENAQAVEADAAVVPAGGLLEKPLRVKVEEAYFDGRYVYAGLSMEADSGEEMLLNYYDEKSMDILINGESQWSEESGLVRNGEGFAYLGLNIGGSWVRESQGVYLAQQSFRVPEKFRGAESLDITLRFSKVIKENGGALNSTPFQLDFTVENTGEQVRAMDGNGLESNGIKLVSAVATPVGTEFTLEYPDGFSPDTGAQFENGQQLGALADTDRESLENGGFRYTRVFSGLKEDEARKVVYYVYDKSGSYDGCAAVFLLDFANGTAELGTEEDIVEYHDVMYHCGWENLEGFTGTHKIALASLKESGNNLVLFLATTDSSPRELRVEVAQDGETICSGTVSRENQNNFHGYVYWEENPEAEGETVEYDTGMNCYRWAALGMEALDPAREAEFTVTDSATGQVLDRETILLDPAGE